MDTWKVQEDSTEEGCEAAELELPQRNCFQGLVSKRMRVCAAFLGFFNLLSCLQKPYNEAECLQLGYGELDCREHWVSWV